MRKLDNRAPEMLVPVGARSTRLDVRRWKGTKFDDSDELLRMSPPYPRMKKIHLWWSSSCLRGLQVRNPASVDSVVRPTRLSAQVEYEGGWRAPRRGSLNESMHHVIQHSLVFWHCNPPASEFSEQCGRTNLRSRRSII